jgi:hypothetical protein
MRKAFFSLSVLAFVDRLRRSSRFCVFRGGRHVIFIWVIGTDFRKVRRLNEELPGSRSGR